MKRFLKETEKGIFLFLWVQPSAPKSEIVGIVDNALKIKVSASPHEGKANEACLKLLAKVFKIPPSALALVKGKTSCRKVFQITTLSLEEIQKRLEKGTKKTFH